MASEVEGDDMRMDEAEADVGVLGIAATRFIISFHEAKMEKFPARRRFVYVFLLTPDDLAEFSQTTMASHQKIITTTKLRRAKHS